MCTKIATWLLGETPGVMVNVQLEDINMVVKVVHLLVSFCNIFDIHAFYISIAIKEFRVKIKKTPSF